VFAVPRSMARSLENNEKNEPSGTYVPSSSTAM
jgi:hypothetical protein